MVVDTGNNFVKKGKVQEAARGQLEIKAQNIAQSIKEIGITAMVPGQQDLLLGRSVFLELAKTYELPYVAANLTSAHGDLVFKPHLIAEVGGRKVAFIGLAAEAMGVGGFDVVDAHNALVEQLKAVEGQSDAVIVLSSMGLNRTGELLKGVEGVDFALLSGSGRTTDPPLIQEKSVLLEAGRRGKMIGVLEMRFKADGIGWEDTGADARRAEKLKRVNERLASIDKRFEGARSDRERQSLERQKSFYLNELESLQKAEKGSETAGVRNAFDHRYEKLSRSVADEPKVAAIVQAGKDAIEKGEGSPLGATPAATPDPFEGVIGPARIEARAKAGHKAFGDFVGDKVCAGCHASEYTQWQGTGHAKAYAALVEDSRSQDYQCFSCHITGHGQPGGPDDPKDVGYLKNVQCESCHTSGAKHVKNPVQNPLPKAVPEATCLSCHTKEMTGDQFDYAKYLPKVKHAH